MTKIQKAGSLVQATTQTMASGQEKDYPTKRNPEFFRQKVFQVCPDFKVTNANRELLNSIYDYVHGGGILDPEKGILFYGPVGTGKSTLMKILAEYQRIFGKGFACVNTSYLTGMYATYGNDALDESTWNRGSGIPNPVERGFDELGRETSPAKYYGNELNVMQQILQIRYDLKVKTHATTNLQIHEIETRYGEHIYDRCFEMFNFVEVKGESFRI